MNFSDDECGALGLIPAWPLKDLPQPWRAQPCCVQLVEWLEAQLVAHCHMFAVRAWMPEFVVQKGTSSTVAPLWLRRASVLMRPWSNNFA